MLSMDYGRAGAADSQGGGAARAIARLRHDPQALIAIGLILVAIYGLSHSVSSLVLLELAVVIPSIMLHEIAHGAVAFACGDDTAKRAGRLTLNPLRHVDPVGTLLLPALLALSGLGVFGYAKPVPVNPSRMRHPRNDAVLVSLAGPATNLVLAAISVVVLRYLCAPGTVERVYNYFYYVGAPHIGVGLQLLFLLGFLNVLLAVFNALPIPPLDGAILIERLLPSSALPTWWMIRRYAMIGLLLIVLLDRSLLADVFNPVARAWLHFLVS
jgi:Zn-dependent protease